MMVAVLLICGTLAGCTTGFLYNRIDLLVSWYVDGLVSLDGNQSQRLRAGVRDVLEWHRQTQVPKAIALLEEIRVDLRSPVTADSLDGRYQEMVALMDAAIARSVPGAAALLSSLSVEQIDELAASLDEDNDELRKEYSGATPEVRLAKRSKSAVRILQRFVGRLSSQQRALIGARVAALYDNSEPWLARRRAWQQHFLELLRARPPQQEFEAALRDLVLDPDRYDSAEYRRHAAENRRMIMLMLAEVINGLDAAQQEHLLRKLKGYEEDLTDIALRG